MNTGTTTLQRTPDAAPPADRPRVPAIAIPSSMAVARTRGVLRWLVPSAVPGVDLRPPVRIRALFKWLVRVSSEGRTTVRRLTSWD